MKLKTTILAQFPVPNARVGYKPGYVGFMLDTLVGLTSQQAIT